MSHSAYLTTVIDERTEMSVDLAFIPSHTLYELGYPVFVGVGAESLTQFVNFAGMDLHPYLSYEQVDLNVLSEFLLDSAHKSLPAGKNADKTQTFLFVQDLLNSELLVEFSPAKKIKLWNAVAKVQVAASTAQGGIFAAAIATDPNIGRERTALIIISSSGALLMGSLAGFIFKKMMERS